MADSTGPNESDQKQAVQQEQSQEGGLSARLTQWIAFTITLMAIATSFTSSASGNANGDIVNLTHTETNKWAYFQAKSMKEQIFNTKQLLLEVEAKNVKTPEAKSYIESMLSKSKEEVTRFQQEKKALQAEVDKLHADVKTSEFKAYYFGIGLQLLQIGILCASVGALFAFVWLWRVGLVFAVVGFLNSLNGWYSLWGAG